MRRGSTRPDSRPIDLDWRRATALFALLGAVQFTLIATITIITVALPAIERDLHVGETGMVLISSSYGLAFGGLLLLGGRLADVLGHRRMLSIGMIVFGSASVAAGFAPSAGILVIARFAQGVGGALTAPTALAVVAGLFADHRRRTRAMAVWGVLSSAGATAGTVLSGAVITWVPWRWVFLAPVAISALAVPAVIRLLPGDHLGPRRGRIDWLGAALATSGLALLIYGLQSSGWSILGGGVLLVVFAVTEHRSSVPLLPLQFLSRRLVPLIAVTACAGTMATGFYLLSLHLQQVRGLSTLQTSASFLLSAPVALASSFVADRLIARLAARYVVAIGLLTAAVGSVLLGFVDAPYAGLVVFPLGAGVTFSAATVAALQNVPPDQAGLAGGLVNTAMEIGPPLGLAALVSLAAAHSSHPAIGDAFALRAAGVALLAVALLSAIPMPHRTSKGESE